MPYKSKAQKRYVQGVAHGMTPRKGDGMTQEAAKKFAAHSEGQSTKKLPEHVKKKGKK